jgi:hypothetical protein
MTMEFSYNKHLVANSIPGCLTPFLFIFQYRRDWESCQLFPGYPKFPPKWRAGKEEPQRHERGRAGGLSAGPVICVAGITTPRGKIITEEQGRPIRIGGEEGVAQAAGFRPERLARVSREHWAMENVQRHFKEKRDDLYSRCRLAKNPEDKKKVLRKMQRFNLDSKKYRGVISPITATLIRQTTQQKPEKSFIGFGKMMEASP